jgi:hypothetical protein
MSYSMYGGAAAMLFVLGIGGYSAIDRTANYAPAKGSVFLIDRKCDMTETTSTAKGMPVSSRKYRDDCKTVDEWDTIKEKRSKVVSGTAVVKVAYVAPQDGTNRTSELRFDGRDDEFYELKAGDEIDVLVSKSDPNKIIQR